MSPTPADYQIDYKISKNAKISVGIIFLIFLSGVIVKIMSLFVQPTLFDFALTGIFSMFLSFSTAAMWAFLIKKRPVVAISSKYLSVSVPYFFKIQKIKLTEIKEVKISVWGRSEIVVQSGLDTYSYSFMSPFLSSEDRESFLSNIFDLLPNTSVR